MCATTGKVNISRASLGLWKEHEVNCQNWDTILTGRMGEARGITMLCAGGINWLLKNEGNVNPLRGEKQRSRVSRDRKPNFVACSF